MAVAGTDVAGTDVAVAGTVVGVAGTTESNEEVIISWKGQV